MDIMEIGPRKIILGFISKKTAELEHDAHGEHQHLLHEKTVQSVLADEPKFQRTLKRLNAGSIPVHNDLLKMNRILTNFYFERMILEEKRYPSWREKQELACKIISAFPQLEITRVSPDAPRESFFFWRNKGRGKGSHHGIIETRVANMRKDLPSEERKFQRPKPTSIELPDGIHDNASYMAALTPSSQNIREISEKMSQCTVLHQWLLQQQIEVTSSILKIFPHILAYDGLMIQQAFDRLHPNANKDFGMESFLQIGMLVEENGWESVEDAYIRGALRFLKKLTHCGIKRKVEEDMTIEEFMATPLIRWVKVQDTTSSIAIKNHVHANPDLPPHLVCCADTFKKGDLYVVFTDFVVPCGKSGDMAIDILLKIHPVLGMSVPVLLKKLYDLVAINVWGIQDCSTSTKVTQLTLRLREFCDTSL
ncbi:uncharacterized protein LOC110675951 [Aedes aegypti]|uniref:Uncharacterized protein n=1 Tax=Aedes aegypti TaxID=7159 RepID=A0A6I8U9K0_AEDAE|nr:uncharacterized protein LOC110675951 [Aedes aegypti]